MDKQILDKILNKDLENIIKKASSGKTLTDAERARIKEFYGESQSPTYVKSAIELANILGVNRKTIARWKKNKSAPKPLPNGSYKVEDWQAFVKQNELKEPESQEETQLKSRKLLAEVKQAEIKLKVMEGTYVSLERVRSIWLQHIGQVRQILESRLLNELPPILTTLNAIEIREKLQDVLDESYKAISNSTDELKDPIDLED